MPEFCYGRLHLAPSWVTWHPCPIQPNRKPVNILTDSRNDTFCQNARELTDPPFCQPLRAVVVTCSLWRSYCFVQRCPLIEQMARRYRTMEAFRASGVAKDSDAALVAATKRGETLAFEKLVLRYK